MTNSLNLKATSLTRRRYNRLARWYDLLQRNSEQRMAPWRAEVWKKVTGSKVLEIGVGTGKNLPYYPPRVSVTAIDFSPQMLERARTKAKEQDIKVELSEADVQALPFKDGSFDTVIATCVFCSVPDPVLGFEEVRRVLAPGGQLVLLEHVLSHRRVLRFLMRMLNPLVVRLAGANINRETIENLYRAGFTNLEVKELWLDIVKLIEVRLPVTERAR